MPQDTDQECVMHSKSDNIKIMINDKADEVIQELFQSLFSRYQIGLETSMKGSEICLWNSRIKSWRNKKTFYGITKIKPFISKYNWEGINYQSAKDDLKKF